MGRWWRACRYQEVGRQQLWDTVLSVCVYTHSMQLTPRLCDARCILQRIIRVKSRKSDYFITYSTYYVGGYSYASYLYTDSGNNTLYYSPVGVRQTFFLDERNFLFFLLCTHTVTFDELLAKRLSCAQRDQLTERREPITYCDARCTQIILVYTVQIVPYWYCRSVAT